MNTLTSRCVLLKPLVSLKWIPNHCHVGEFLTGLFNTRQVQLRPPTLTLFVQFHGAIYTLLWVVSKQKKSAWIPKKKHTPQKQVILDDVGGDIISKIPTSPSFLLLFEHIKYDWNKSARLHPFKTNNLRQLFTDHYTTFHEVLVFCFGTRPRFPRKKITLLTIPNLVPIKKLCQAPSCATHGGESYSVFLMGIGGKKMGGSLCGWTAVSIITPFPGTSTLGVGAARAIWVRLEIVSWRIMVKIEHLGNQNPESFCRCSFWRIFTGHVLFCSWIFFFALQLISGPKKNTLATQQTFCNYIPASPRVKLGDPAWSNDWNLIGVDMWMECGCKVETNNFTLSLLGASCCINLPTKGRFVFKGKIGKTGNPPIFWVIFHCQQKPLQISQLPKGSENQSTRWNKCSKQRHLWTIKKHPVLRKSFPIPETPKHFINNKSLPGTFSNSPYVFEQTSTPFIKIYLLEI